MSLQDKIDFFVNNLKNKPVRRSGWPDNGFIIPRKLYIRSVDSVVLVADKYIEYDLESVDNEYPFVFDGWELIHNPYFQSMAQIKIPVTNNVKGKCCEKQDIIKSAMDGKPWCRNCGWKEK